jgi:hypothetical protein
MRAEIMPPAAKVAADSAHPAAASLLNVHAKEFHFPRFPAE